MLEVRALSKSFGGLRAVHDLDLAVAEGEIVSLIGPNGAGKTTVFALISGFLKPDGGSIFFQGRDITGLKPHHICRQGVVRTFQIVQPFANLSVLQNIAVGAHTRISSRAAALVEAESVAERLGMSGLLGQPAGSLTIAGRKRLELARALATGPRLLLLDEVMAGLNATEIEEIVLLVEGIRADGISILVIEHVMQAVMRLSDRTYVINNGALIAHGAPEQVAKDVNVIEAYLGHGAAATLAAGGARA